MSIVQHTADRVIGLARNKRIHRAGSSFLFAVPVLAFLLTGCGSARPIKYYQLTYPAPAPVTQNPLNVALLVRSFDSLSIYKEDRIVYGWNANELGTYESQRLGCSSDRIAAKRAGP